MSKTIKTILYLILFLSISSCEKEITVDIPDNHSKLVVSCHLGVNDSIRVDVSASIPLYETSTGEVHIVETAIVKLSADQQNWITLTYNPIYQTYSQPIQNFNIIEGNTYYIEVSASGYNTVTSQVTIPVYQPIEAKLVKMDSLIYYDPNYRYIQAQFSFRDVANQANFYGVKAYGKNDGQWIELYSNDDKLWVFSDKQMDGKEFVFNFEGAADLNCDSVKFRILQTTESFYLFHYSMYNYSPEDPFTEATPVYSNINNGLGIFSGYTYRDYMFALR